MFTDSCNLRNFLESITHFVANFRLCDRKTMHDLQDSRDSENGRGARGGRLGGKTDDPGDQGWEAGAAGAEKPRLRIRAAVPGSCPRKPR